MKRSDTLFRHKATLLYDTGASIREMVYAITQKLNSPVIDFRVYADMDVCDRVGAWIMDNDGMNGEFGLFTTIHRIAGQNDIRLVVEGEGSYRDEEMYDYSLDELIYLHNEIEKIYKYVVKGKKEN
jgi:hypothetical protein